MEQWEKDWIDKNSLELYAETSVHLPLLEILKKANVLTQEEVDEHERKKKQEDDGAYSAKVYFYRILKTRLGAYQKLINALDKTSQDGAVKILKEGQKQHDNPEEYGESQSPGGKREVSKLTVDKDVDEEIMRELNFIKSPYPFTVVVKDGKKVESPLPSDYDETPKGKKIALIANIIEFDDSRQNRKGADVDTHYLTTLWEGLGWNVINVGEASKAHPNGGYITKDALEKAIEDLKKRCCLYWVDGIVVYLSSHGAHDWIYTSDEEWVHIYTHVMYQFNHQKCEDMIKKPKLFFQNSCVIFPKLTPPHKDCGPEKMGMIEDAVLVRPHIPGGVSHRHPIKGTHFAVTLTLVLMHLAWKHNFAELMGLVYDYMGCIKANFEKDECPQQPHVDSFPFPMKKITLFTRRK